VNIVLDDTIEYLRDSQDPYKLTTATRKLGLVVCKGNSVMCVYPEEGTKEIDNPYAEEDGEGPNGEGSDKEE